MENTYLTQKDKTNIIEERKTYINNNFYSDPIIQYRQLPEEYDVFSEIHNELKKLNGNINTQQEFINLFCNTLKSTLLKEVEYNGIRTILPKFSINKDSEDAYILNLTKNNYRIFINFEKNIDNSFYGIILQQVSDSYFSTTGKINSSNYLSLIDNLSKIILSN